MKQNVVAKHEKVKCPKKKKEEETKYTLVFHAEDKNDQGLRQLFLTVSWDNRAWPGTPNGVLVSK